MTSALSFIHRFEPGSDPAAPPLLLLHGTGGDETDLLPLGRMIAPGSALLSPRGQVLENGMPRFFRRLREGVFDEADVRLQAQALAAFVAEARAAYGLAAPIAVGFSNGANIAAALMLLHPDVLAAGSLIRAMVPLTEPGGSDLTGTPVQILSGANDPIVPTENPARLAAMLSARGAIVEHKVLPGGHGLSQTDVTLAKAWLDTIG
ncbi:alpha/beta hydrolase [Acidisoma cladoniae]|uniref:alpha/beta hydrolase n=1 Tax=Acidisoma cladoniae TaxID=3040935 RepID=UPI002549DFD0|nr:alpha/beta hydrolase [Acidisoma sp. PAMC 29798]